jgi:hypothetical protein
VVGVIRAGISGFFDFRGIFGIFVVDVEIRLDSVIFYDERVSIH